MLEKKQVFRSLLGTVIITGSANFSIATDWQYSYSSIAIGSASWNSAVNLQISNGSSSVLANTGGANSVTLLPEALPPINWMNGVIIRLSGGTSVDIPGGDTLSLNVEMEVISYSMVLLLHYTI